MHDSFFANLLYLTVYVQFYDARSPYLSVLQRFVKLVYYLFLIRSFFSAFFVIYLWSWLKIRVTGQALDRTGTEALTAYHF